MPENDAFSGQLIAVVQWFRCVTQHWQPALVCHPFHALHRLLCRHLVLLSREPLLLA